VISDWTIVFGEKYLVHRLMWLYHYGEWPKEQVDHIDHCGTSNRIENLREASSTINQHNLGKNKKNTSGVTGVFPSYNQKKWLAFVNLQGKTKYLGTFPTLELAAAARQEANILYGFHPNHGLDLSLTKPGETI